MGAVIQALTGSTNRDEVNVMAKQATEVASLVISLAQALATSMSQRSFYWTLPDDECIKKFFQYFPFGW